jgi:hypothetical protein
MEKEGCWVGLKKELQKNLGRIFYRRVRACSRVRTFIMTNKIG